MEPESERRKVGYLELQAMLGVSKHNGGPEATDALLDMCEVAGPLEVLYVGSGAGVGPTWIARRRGCRVVAVDNLPKMIEWSRLRASREGMTSRIEFRVADVRSLPFATDRFDAVIVESVLSFLDDKREAIAECVRVTKPGGRVGANEGCWRIRPPLVAERAASSLGTSISMCDEWPGIWADSGLTDTQTELRAIDAREEVVGRIEWMGRRWALETWVRAAKLAARRADVREAIKEQLAPAPYMVHAMGYYLMAGRKA